MLPLTVVPVTLVTLVSELSMLAALSGTSSSPRPGEAVKVPSVRMHPLVTKQPTVRTLFPVTVRSITTAVCVLVLVRCLCVLVLPKVVLC